MILLMHLLYHNTPSLRQFGTLNAIPGGQGSKNRQKEPADPLVPKSRRGRPPGTGPKQKAAAAAALASNSDWDSDESAAPAKHPVGCPSKIPRYALFKQDSVRRGVFMYLATDVIQSSTLSPIFDGTSPAQPPPPDVSPVN
ncbi:hypothetical protein C8J57DRAFT_1712155 [Mycena rebaudengoi]|nr:hypothetical protein C8J57DRAFT_1712155 [Mycena rebaudengoi]